MTPYGHKAVRASPSGMPCEVLLAADRGGLYPLDRAVPALPSRHGRGMDVVRPCNFYRFTIPFAHLKNHLKLKPGRVPFPFLSHFDHLSSFEAIVPDWPLSTWHIRWCNFSTALQLTKPGTRFQRYPPSPVTNLILGLWRRTRRTLLTRPD